MRALPIAVVSAVVLVVGLGCARASTLSFTPPATNVFKVTVMCGQNAIDIDLRDGSGPGNGRPAWAAVVSKSLNNNNVTFRVVGASNFTLKGKGGSFPLAPAGTTGNAYTWTINALPGDTVDYSIVATCSNGVTVSVDPEMMITM